MAGIFLSYDRDDGAKARQIALALEKAGHSVWWDLHVRGGAQFSKVIEEALKAADAIVVLWSSQSVESSWVRDEAAVGRDSGRLVPVSLDETEPPLGFRQFQTIDLNGWKGRGRVPRLAELLGVISVLGTADAPAPFPASAALTEGKKGLRRFLPIGVGAVAFVLVAALLLVWRPWAPRTAAATVAVIPAGRTIEATGLARDLLVQLGNLQSHNPDALKLVTSASERPELILEVDGASRMQEMTAGLVLLNGRDRALLWSRDFSQPRNRGSDLREQVAYSAAMVLACAAEAANAERGLPDEIRKLFLNGCAELAEEGGAGPSAAVVQMFERVTREAPWFRGGWARLLTAEGNLATENFATTGQYGVASSLRRHIAEARKLHGEIPESIVAELVLMPRDAFAERIERAERAKKLGEENPAALLARAHELMSVGRMNEALPDAERAMQFDPLSPSTRNSYVSILAYSGRLAVAEAALKEAERIWPGSSSVLDAKFRFHLRYGDPAVALEIYRNQKGTLRLHEFTLRARINRTPENIESAVTIAKAAFARFGEVVTLAQILTEFGREDEAHTILAQQKQLRVDGSDLLFRPNLKRFRQDPRFMMLAKRFGLIDYWQSSGHWPDFCFESGLPYDCKAEAAKLG